MRRNEKQFLLVCVLPLTAAVVAAPVLFFVFPSHRTRTLLPLGMDVYLLTWMLAALLYVAWDSRRRWSGRRFMDRLGSILTFQR